MCKACARHTCSGARPGAGRDPPSGLCAKEQLRQMQSLPLPCPFVSYECVMNANECLTRGIWLRYIEAEPWCKGGKMLIVQGLHLKLVLLHLDVLLFKDISSKTSPLPPPVYYQNSLEMKPGL